VNRREILKCGAVVIANPMDLEKAARSSIPPGIFRRFGRWWKSDGLRTFTELKPYETRLLRRYEKILDDAELISNGQAMRNNKSAPPYFIEW